MDYIDGFPYTEPFLYLWDEASLIVVNDSFYEFLDSVAQNFVQYFCIDVHEGDWSEVLLPCLVLLWVQRMRWVVFLEFLFHEIV